MKKIKIGDKYVGGTEKPYFIADIASNHDGDLERAYRLIELAKEAGADAAKFQNFHADTIVSDLGFKTLGSALSHQKSWKKSIYEIYDDASVPDIWTQMLKRKCDEVGIEYMTSPYDFEAVNLVEPYVNAYKIGSGDITWTQIIDHIAGKDKPVLIATGASDMVDVQRAVELLEKKDAQIVLMQCNTNYTAEDENFKYINLNVLKKYAALYPNVVLGLSDHTHGYATVLGAIALGASVIEKHFTDDNDRTGPDHKFSMNPKMWREMVDESNRLWVALGDGIKRVEENEKETVIVQRRSLYYSKDLGKGLTVNKEDLIPLRPAKEGAVLPFDITKVIGKKLKKNVSKDTLVKWEDFI